MIISKYTGIAKHPFLQQRFHNLLLSFPNFAAPNTYSTSSPSLRPGMAVVLALFHVQLFHRVYVSFSIDLGMQ